MTAWELVSALYGPDADELAAGGWEPFAIAVVDAGHPVVYFRRERSIDIHPDPEDRGQ